MERVCPLVSLIRLFCRPWQTLLLTLIGTLLSILIGGLLALARLSSSRLLNCLAWGYIWLFRSLPLIVGADRFLYNFSYLYDTLTIGIPFTPHSVGKFETINVLGQFSTAVVGLTLVQSAYTAEIIRGILGVDHGQYEAAAALGLPAGGRRTLRIILPQALRTILPAGFNEIISGERDGDGICAGNAGAVLHHPDDI